MDRHRGISALLIPPKTHARRCCALCRQRKTRCELPAAVLSLPASPDPLPSHHACHRCIALSLQCILLPAQVKRVKKDSRSAIPLVPPSLGDKKSVEPPVDDLAGSMSASMSRARSPPNSLVHHDLDILTTFNVTADEMVRAARRPL